ncbi:hypothetical protein [Aquimarina sediminis]|uniref:hypothetical protein n=1 Tax=Aquimarina sediminis TaxID=2070536 RepID=UPI000CA06BC0|nr:hypothetical protein [Aquimarina sediminis]
MKKIGSYLAIAGVISIVLNLFNYNLRILLWIDAWGVTPGWIIRGGIILLGLVLFFLGSKNVTEEENVQP